MLFKPLFILTILVSFSCDNHADSALRKNNSIIAELTSAREDNPYARIGDIPLPQNEWKRW